MTRQPTFEQEDDVNVKIGASNREISSSDTASAHSRSSTLTSTSNGSHTTPNADEMDRVATANAGHEGGEPEVAITQTVSGPPYSIFTKKQKRFIVFMAAFGASFSPIAGNIYFPALNPISADLGVSNNLINLTLTSYMIFQGLAPTFMGDFADTAGRRPAYLLCIVIFVCANIGLALQDSYAALLVLRCFQSAGSSATLALASGIVGDISTAAERGTYQGMASIGSQLGPSLGPVLGGVLAQFLGWRAIFWFLLIMGATFLVPFLLFFPETSRNVVGDGSIPPQTWNMNLTSYLQLRRRRKAEKDAGVVDSQSLRSTRSRSSSKPRKFRFPNPLVSIRLLRNPTTALLLIFNAFMFSSFYYILTTVPSQYAKIYHFNTLQVALCYIPFGIGGSLAAFFNGRVLDWNFRRTAKRLGMKVDRKRQADLNVFPVEQARLQVSLPIFYTATSLILIYGWILDIGAPLPAPLVLLFFLGYAVTSTFNTNQTLLIDFHPTQPSTATAANNLLRCLLGAGALAVLDPLIQAMGIGWVFTLLVGILLIFSPILWYLYFNGMKMRQRRFAEAEKHRKEKEENARQSSRDEIDQEKGVEEPPVAVGGMMESDGLREVEKEIQEGERPPLHEQRI